VKKIKYYLDTTIFNFVFAESDTEKKDITVKFFKELPLIADGVYISDEVIREVSRAPEPRKSQLEGLIRNTNPFLLEIDLETEELAERYIREGIIPERYRRMIYYF
jgi:hypothetical protein